MYFLFKDRLVTIYKIRTTFIQKQNIFTLLLILDFEFRDTWDTFSVLITPLCPYCRYFAYLALYNINTLPTDLTTHK